MCVWLEHFFPTINKVECVEFILLRHFLLFNSQYFFKESDKHTHPNTIHTPHTMCGDFIPLFRSPKSNLGPYTRLETSEVLRI